MILGFGLDYRFKTLQRIYQELNRAGVQIRTIDIIEKLFRPLDVVFTLFIVSKAM